MKAVVFLILIAIVLLITNPSEESHRNEIRRYARTQASQAGLLGGIGSSLGLTDIAIDAIPLEYNNRYLFSTTSIDGERISYGIIGFVKVED